MDFKDILVEIADSLDLSLAEMAEKLGENRSKLYNMKGGRWNPNYEFCRKLLVTFPQVSAEFVMTGSGNVLKTAELSAAGTGSESLDKDLIIEALTEQVKKYKQRVSELEAVSAH